MQPPTTNHILQIPEPLLKLADSIHAAGGQSIVVGGTVRDYILGLDPKDIDLEIHGLSAARLEEILKQHARVKKVGKAFQVWKCRFLNTSEIDITLPCDENGIESPHIGFAQAAERRDFKINTMGYDIYTKSILDPLNAQADIADGIIRMTSSQQLEFDPLRLFRAVQFSARFNLTIEPAIIDIAQTIPIKHLPHERVRTEIEKIFLRGVTPSLGLNYAQELNLWSRYTPKLDTSNWPEIAQATDRLRQRCLDDLNSALPLFWSLLLSHTDTTDQLSILERFGISSTSARNIHAILMHWQKVCHTCSSTDLNHLAENATISDLCTVASALFPQLEDIITQNYNMAVSLNISHQPLPTLITGGTLFKLGYRGKNISSILSDIRLLQLNEQIHNIEDVHKIISSNHPSSE